MADCAVAPLKSCRYRTDARRNLQGRDTRQINHRPSLTNALSGSQLSAQTQNVDSSAGARKAAGWVCRNLDISGRAGRCRSDKCVPAHLYWPARSPLGRQSILPWDDTSGEKPLGGARRPNFQNAYCNRVVALEEAGLFGFKCYLPEASISPPSMLWSVQRVARCSKASSFGVNSV
jgi:hypothetical protein